MRFTPMAWVLIHTYYSNLAGRQRSLLPNPEKSLDVFLEVCKEQGIEPRRHYSGKFNLRIPPELHEKLAMTAEAQGMSLNSLAQEALQRSVSA